MGDGVEIPIIGKFVKINWDDATKQEFSSAIKQMTGVDFGSFDAKGLAGGGAQMASGAGDAIMKVMQTTMSIVEDIYKKLVESSPLLQAVESLFNLAMQLFFMPLGNKLAEEFLPAIMDMIDEVMDFWDKMDGKGLDEILDATLDKFVDIFVGLLNKIGTQLATHGGLIGAIGKLLTTIGGLMTTILPKIINFSVEIMKWLADNFPILIGTIVAFKVATITLMLAQIAATMSSSLNPAAWILGIGGVATLASGIGVGAWIGGMGGGGVPNNTPNSSYDRVNTPNINNSNGSYTVNVYGYTDRELGSIIEDKVNEMSNRSRLRSGL